MSKPKRVTVTFTYGELNALVTFAERAETELLRAGKVPTKKAERGLTRLMDALHNVDNDGW